VRRRFGKKTHSLIEGKRGINNLELDLSVASSPKPEVSSQTEPLAFSKMVKIAL
jgi:hypothetical protein